MSKEAINIKSNGIRNELKEIRNSIDKLTEVLLLQTHTHDEKKDYNIDWKHIADGLRWYPTATNESEKNSVQRND